MAGLKERRLKRYQRGEEEYNDAVAQILAEGSIGHDKKEKRRQQQSRTTNGLPPGEVSSWGLW